MHADCFDCDSQACREFVNRNAACASPNKSPELLAKYADSLLRKSNKANEEEDLEQSLVDTVSQCQLASGPARTQADSVSSH